MAGEKYVTLLGPKAAVPAAEPIPNDQFLAAMRQRHDLLAGSTGSTPIARADVIHLLELSGDLLSAETWKSVVDRVYDIPVAALGRTLEQIDLVQGFGKRGKALVDRERELLAEIARLKDLYEPKPTTPGLSGRPNPFGKRFSGGIGAAYERDWAH